MRSFAFVLVAGVSLAACSSSGGSGGGGSGDAGDGGGLTDAGTDANPSGSEAAAPEVCMSDAGAPSASEFANVPTCTAHECVLTGTLHGASVIQSYVPGAFAFNNGSGFDVDFGTGGHVHLAFSGQVPDGTAANATGTLLTPSDWAYPPAPSATICAGDGTRIMPTSPDAGSTQVQFILRCMSGGCDGGAGIDGELDGCCMP